MWGNDSKHFSVTLWRWKHTYTHRHTHALILKLAYRRVGVSSNDPGLMGVGYLRIKGIFIVTGLLPAFAKTDDLENPNCLLCIFQVYR